jgi:hypothetical protein
LNLLLAIAHSARKSRRHPRARGSAPALAAEALSTNGVCAFGHPTLADAMDEAAD